MSEESILDAVRPNYPLVMRMLSFAFPKFSLKTLEKYILRRVSGEVKVVGLLGRGGFHVVLEGEFNGEPCAYRLLFRNVQPIAAEEAAYAAHILCGKIGVPTPLYIRPPIYSPQKSTLAKVLSLRFAAVSVLSLADGIPLSRCWSGAKTDFKKNVLKDFAIMFARLASQKFTKIGGLVFQKGIVGVGEMNSAVMDAAEKVSGVRIDRGPFDDLSEYLSANMRALQIVFAHCPIRYRTSLLSNLTIAAELIPYVCRHRNWVEDGVNYVCHADLSANNVLVHPVTGHIQSILDWDGTNIQPLDCFAVFPANAFPAANEEEEEEDWDLRHFYAAELRSLKLEGIADFLIEEEDDAFSNVMDWMGTVEKPMVLDPNYLDARLYFMLRRLAERDVLTNDQRQRIMTPVDIDDRTQFSMNQTSWWGKMKGVFSRPN